MRTNLIAANHNQTNSLRTTVPLSIVEMLGLKVGDQLEWSLEPRDNKFHLVVRAVKKDG